MSSPIGPAMPGMPSATPEDPAGGAEGGAREPTTADKASQAGRTLGAGNIAGGSTTGLMQGAKANADAGMEALSSSARVNEGTSTNARDTVEKNNRSRLGGG